MSTWTLIQIVFDLFMACGLFVVVMRMNRAPKDDPRLSRGLALLQSKISVLEDLSDRTEAQVASLISVLESKSREVQAKVELADRHVAEIRVAVDRSLEVASIFQDKIPHKEIIERQNTIKYVQAARLAHAGVSVEEIAKQVDLPHGELEFIVSVNRERLMFAEEELPEWARSSGGVDSGGGGSATGAGSASASMFAASMSGMNFDESGGAASFAAPAGPAAPAGQVYSQGASPAQGSTLPAQGYANPQMFAAQASHAQMQADAAAAAHVESSMTNEERARRLRAEIELTENQRLVENLSRLQTEMQNLDQQLARESDPRATAAAYEVPRVETDHLKKLGEEFRRAVREGEVADQKQPFGSSGGGSFFPPIERLSALIPNILEAGAVDDRAQAGQQASIASQFAAAQAAAAQGPSAASIRASADSAQAAPFVPVQAAFGAQAVPQRAQSSYQAAAPQQQQQAGAQQQRAAAHQTPTPAAPVAAKDPVLARAVAQAKVQAALRSGIKPSPVTRPHNAELQQARAVARDLAGNIVAPAKPGEVRKIAFPRIDSSDL